MRSLLTEILGDKKLDEKLFWEHCPEHRLSIHLSEDFPYSEGDNKEFHYRPEYLNECLSIAENVFKDLDFPDEVIVVYDDIYSAAKKDEKKTIEGFFANSPSVETISFDWHFDDEDDIYTGKRHIFKGENLDTTKLMTKIIISDIGDDTDFSSSVYIIDPKAGNVFWLYDDRGLDVFSADKNVLLPLAEKFEDVLLEIV